VVATKAQLAALESGRLFQKQRCALQSEQVNRLGRELPLPQFHLPKLVSEELGPNELDALAEALSAGIASLRHEVTSP
jgi:hypothetical protein